VTVAKNDTHRALILMTASATMFGAMAFAAKVASARLPGPEIAMLRMAAGLLPCLLVPRYRRSALKFNRIDLLVYRGLFGGLAVLLYPSSPSSTSERRRGHAAQLQHRSERHLLDVLHAAIQRQGASS
jgi:drug/metabolite transporter (DMT)-like permease